MLHHYPRCRTCDLVRFCALSPTSSEVVWFGLVLAGLVLSLTQAAN